VSRREKECGNKAKHSKTKAKAHRWSLIKSRGAHPASVQIYKCSFCGYWHVGHPPKNQKPKKKR